ncbi:MAG: sigma 54-interacting transcriptional regulator, partial [Clostridia bacterium]|nr:sigma 54-interacting transcriptional regulator [Clostridia bacterium]
NDENFIKVKAQCQIFSAGDANILICGETGTGKEVLARAIHNESFRKNRPFVSVMCGGTVDTIVEKELFGDSLLLSSDTEIGKVELAEGGTLFIDEIGDLTLRLQGRLMNVLKKQKEYNLRIISTTSKNLKSMVDHGEFRKDLYYSLETFSITIPPLRQRKSDIILLANYFLEKYNRLEGKEVKLGQGVYEVFTKYAWSGNVREIENVMSFIVSTHNTNHLVGVKELPNKLQDWRINDNAGQYNLEKIEKETIIKALNAFGNSTEAKKQIAKELGISNATLYRKLKKYDIIEIVQFDSQN